MSMKGHRGPSIYKKDKEYASEGEPGTKRISVVIALYKPGLVITGVVAQLDSLLVMRIIGHEVIEDKTRCSIIRR